MKIAFTSDLHGQLPDIKPCDILIIAGDISNLRGDRNIPQTASWLKKKFIKWVTKVPARHIVFTPGNHDFYFEAVWKGEYPDELKEIWPDNLHLLIDQSIEIDGLLIHGTPWVNGLPRWAFNNDDYNKSLRHFQYTVPDKLDILITHAAPAIAQMGTVLQPDVFNHMHSYVSEALANMSFNKKIRYWVCGHIHSGDHEPFSIEGFDTVFFNASYIDENYKPAYPVRYMEIEPVNRDNDAKCTETD